MKSKRSIPDWLALILGSLGMLTGLVAGVALIAAIVVAALAWVFWPLVLCAAAIKYLFF